MYVRINVSSSQRNTYYSLLYRSSARSPLSNRSSQSSQTKKYILTTLPLFTFLYETHAIPTYNFFTVFAQCLEITEKVLFNIASKEASNVHILSRQKLFKSGKFGFWKPEACGQTVSLDRSILIDKKLMENAKIKKWDILVIFKHCDFGCVQSSLYFISESFFLLFWRF